MANEDGALPPAPPPQPPPSPAAAPVRPPSKGVDIIQVLTTAVQKGGSDIIFTVGSKPRIRIGGRLRAYGEDILTPEVTKRMLYSLLTDDQKAHFEEHWEIDASVAIKNVGRFRLNGFRQRGHIGAALRSIPTKMPTTQSLGLPQVLVDIADYPRGLVLVTGPTGSGKSTLLASLINKINSERECHIITIEDPIEFVHSHIKSVIEQREVGADTRTFGHALKYILRQSPDVILLGEMRDRETIQAAITLAETGHLVFSTLHTQTCAQTMDRVIDSFPHEAQNQIRAQLSLTLKTVVCQTLIPTPDGSRCVAAREIMINTPGIASLIREGKQHMITNSIQTGRAQGMMTMEASITDLMKEGLCDPMAATAKINAIRTYGMSDVKGGATPKVTLVEDQKPSEVSRVDDMPEVPDPASAQVVKKVVKELPPLPPIPIQPVVIALILASLAAAGYAWKMALKSPIKLPWAIGAAVVFVIVYVVRLQVAKKERRQAEIRRMLGDD